MSSDYTQDDMRIMEEAARRADEIFPFAKRGSYLREAAKRLAKGTGGSYQAALDGLHALLHSAARTVVERELREESDE